MNDVEQCMKEDPVQVELRAAFLDECRILKDRYAVSYDRLTRWARRMNLNLYEYRAYRMHMALDRACISIMYKKAADCGIRLPEYEKWLRFSQVYEFATGRNFRGETKCRTL